MLALTKKNDSKYIIIQYVLTLPKAFREWGDNVLENLAQSITDSRAGCMCIFLLLRSLQALLSTTRLIVIGDWYVQVQNIYNYNTSYRCYVEWLGDYQNDSIITPETTCTCF